ncbi:MAG: TonB-dependent receptor [Steroidobacteraceae bacterium]
MTRARITAAVSAAVGLGLAAWLPSSAWAQAPAPAAGADQTAQNGQNSANGTGELQEVVVTAERRAEDVQSTPIAVTAVTGAQLQQQNIRTVNDLTTIAPALTVANQGGYQLITMRGVGNTLGEDPITTGVPMILDGLNNPRGTGLQWPMFDIADVEVLRGPQGTFIGSNSTGGAIQVTSANPNFRGINGYVEGEVGDYHDNLAEAAVNLPVSDTFAMRLAIHTEQENSFSSNQGIDRQEIPYASQAMLDPGNTDERSVRLSALWKPTDNFQLLFKAQYDTNNTDGIGYNLNPNTFAPAPGLACPYLTAKNGQCYSEYYAYYSGKPRVLNSGLPFSHYEYWDRFYSGEARYTFNSGTTLRLFAGSEANQTPEIESVCYCSASYGDGYALGGTGIGAEPDTNDQVELDLISPNHGRLQWILGATTTQSNGAFTDYSYTVGPPPGSSIATPTIATIPAGEMTRETGVFGHVLFQLTHTLQLEAGLRGNWDNNYGTGTFNIYPLVNGPVPGLSRTCTAVPCVIPPAAFPGNPPPVYLNNNGNYKLNQQTDKFGLNWQATPNEYAYIFYARGYAPGVTQFHAFSTTQPNAQAETLNDYEIGWKGTFLHHRITTQVDGYYDNYYNMQQNIFNVSAVNNGGLANVPKATIEGIEANMQMQLQHFGANVAAAYTHSALASFKDVPTYKFPAGVARAFGAFLPACAPGVASSATCFQYAPYVITLTGDQDPYAPALTVNVTVQYAIPIGEATLQPRVQFSHMDKQYSTILEQDNYYLMNARNITSAYLDFMMGAWRTTAYMTNISNDLYQTAQTGTNVLYGPPRQYGIQATRTF